MTVPTLIQRAILSLLDAAERNSISVTLLLVGTLLLIVAAAIALAI